MSKTQLRLAASLTLLLSVAACADSDNQLSSAYDSSRASASVTSPAASTSSKDSTMTEATEISAYASVTGDCGAKPTVSVVVGAAAPAALVTSDLCQGDGAVVATGATVTAHYTGIGLQSGKTFDSSWQRGEPVQFPLTGVIQGWSEGIPGMKVGGRRLLVIPGELGYGAYPPPGSGILPDETLVFVVDIVSSP